MNSAQTSRRSSSGSFAGLALVAVLLLGAGAVGCGGEDTTAVKVTTVSDQAASAITPKTPKDEVIKKLGEPLLTQAATPSYPGGCVFYPIEKKSFANVWQFCFNNQGVSLILTALSPEQPAPPAGASPQREALIARADSICQTDYASLSPITEAVSAALGAYSKDPSSANRDEVGLEIRRFVANLEETYERLRAFEAPDDKLDSLNAYLDSLQSQIDTLTQARTAFLKGDDQTYQDLGKQFTDTGTTAKQQAKDYGLTYCSASSFG